MKICPTIKEKCCTIIDEMIILKLWNNHGKASINIHSDNLFKGYKSVIDYSEKLKNKLDKSNIIVHYI